MNRIAKKFVTVGVSIATVASLSGLAAVVPFAGAAVDLAGMSTADLQSLLTQLQALLGGSSSSTTCYQWSGSLTLGSTGPDVTALQNYLTTGGYFTFSGGATGYFGTITQAAVASWQAANGVSPAVGYFGPISQAKYASLCTATPPADDEEDEEEEEEEESTDLEGGAGSITVTDLPTYSSEEVGEGEDDTEVLAFELEAEGSDVLVRSIRVEFVESGATSSEDLDDYAKSVSIWFDGEMVGEADVDDFSESSTEVWTRSISLDEDVIVREDATEEFVVAVSALNNIDSGDSDSDLWTVDVLNVRFKDAEGVTTTEDTDADALEQTFDFAPFADATDLEVKFSLGDEDINDAHVLNVHATAETDDMELLSFEVEVEGTSDVLIKDMSVNFDSVGVDLEDAVTNVTLWVGSDQIGQESITKNTATPGTDETIEFDRINYTVEAGDTVEFLVKADLESIADGIAAGDTISANVAAAIADLMDAEDESGEDIAVADITGGAAGDAHAMYDSGIMVELVSATVGAVVPAEINNTSDSATYSIVYDVTAFDADIFVDGTVTEDGDGAYADGTGNNFYITRQDTGADAAALTTPAAGLTSNTATASANTTWLVNEDTTDRFTLTVSISNTFLEDDADDELLFQLALMSIGWDTTAIAATTNEYTFNLGEFKTPAAALGELDAA